MYGSEFFAGQEKHYIHRGEIKPCHSNSLDIRYEGEMSQEVHKDCDREQD